MPGVTGVHATRLRAVKAPVITSVGEVLAESANGDPLAL